MRLRGRLETHDFGQGAIVGNASAERDEGVGFGRRSLFFCGTRNTLARFQSGTRC